MWNRERQEERVMEWRRGREKRRSRRLWRVKAERGSGIDRWDATQWALWSRQRGVQEITGKVTESALIDMPVMRKEKKNLANVILFLIHVWTADIFWFTVELGELIGFPRHFKAFLSCISLKKNDVKRCNRSPCALWGLSVGLCCQTCCSTHLGSASLLCEVGFLFSLEQSK